MGLKELVSMFKRLTIVIGNDPVFMTAAELGFGELVQDFEKLKREQQDNAAKVVMHPIVPLFTQGEASSSRNVGKRLKVTLPSTQPSQESASTWKRAKKVHVGLAILRWFQG